LIVIVFINYINYIKKQGIFLKKGLIFAAFATAHFQQVFCNGDIVETQFNVLTIRTSRQNQPLQHKLLLVLCSVAMLDNSFTKVSNYTSAIATI
jgi:hypothetical protein